MHIGQPRADHLEGAPELPNAHDLVTRAEDLSATLPLGFHLIGHLKGTSFPIGLRVDEQRQGHAAVLGMSGMGKTVCTQRLAVAYGAYSPVIALDTTGEYSSRLAFPQWTVGDFTTAGHFVHEPAGDPPTRAKGVVETCMTAGHAEYSLGHVPTPRVLVLEEAHTYVPEWNFGQRNQQDAVSDIGRMVMQARKFGITFVVVSQRTAVVSKSVLSQCENCIVLKTIDKTSLEYLETFVGPDLRDAVAGLQRHEALCVGPGFNSTEPVIVSLAA